MIPVTVALTPQQTPAGPQSLVRSGKMAPVNGTPKHTSIHNLFTSRKAYANQDPVKFCILSHIYSYQFEYFKTDSKCGYYCSRSTLNLWNYNLYITLLPCDLFTSQQVFFTDSSHHYFQRLNHSMFSYSHRSLFSILSVYSPGMISLARQIVATHTHRKLVKPEKSESYFNCMYIYSDNKNLLVQDI